MIDDSEVFSQPVDMEQNVLPDGFSLDFFIVHGFQLGSHVVKGDLRSDWNQEHKKELSKSIINFCGSL